MNGDEAMTTKLTEPLRREIEIDGNPFTVLITPAGLRLSRKRFRQGRLVSWRGLWEQGEHENAAISRGPGAEGTPPALTEHPDPTRRI
ncbi:MAG: hypothetical protein ABJA80_16110 [bacterium]